MNAIAQNNIFLQTLQQQYPGLVQATNGGELRCTRSALRPLLLILRDRYNVSLVDLVVTDRMREEGRFVLHYVLLSHMYSARLVLTVHMNETLAMPSIKSLFPAAG